MKIAFNPIEYRVDCDGFDELLVIQWNSLADNWLVIRESWDREAFATLAEAEDRATEIVKEALS